MPVGDSPPSAAGGVPGAIHDRTPRRAHNPRAPALQHLQQGPQFRTIPLLQNQLIPKRPHEKSLLSAIA